MKQRIHSRLTIEQGHPHPLGATPDKHGVNFTVFSEYATAVQLLLFEHHDSPLPALTIDLDPTRNRTFSFWHVYVRGLKPSAYYAYRVDGPNNLCEGHRFNKTKVLADPYAKGVTNTLWSRDDAAIPSKDNLTTSMRCVVIDSKEYDWDNDAPLGHAMNSAIIYEMHVAGFTKSPTSRVRHPGTFHGIIEKIPYLKELGITAVELLPVCEFDEKEILRVRSDGTELRNYWGYSPLGFFAPESRYCVHAEAGKHLDEFRDMVKALHRAGIEVILDVVFNHTDEGDHNGPTISFKGFANNIYYALLPQDKQYYLNFSGCGNTLKCNHPFVQKFILECLQFWVQDMHIDGFRFDEGSILSRGINGEVLEYPPVLWSIELSEVFADTKLIAEAWDAGGLYEVGSFAGFRWSEWNGKFRDDVRKFVSGTGGMIGAIASRIAGSADLYQHSRHAPTNSINFVTCHDGFTLMDLVSYNEKHNEANGENNRDGVNANWSYNYGVEGDTKDPAIIALRKQQIKNYAAVLLLSQGVPMFCAGDEIGRTQQGNNNAYCQDNAVTWIDWALVKKNADLFRFFKTMIAFRKRHTSLCRTDFFKGTRNARGIADIAWHGTRLCAPQWKDPSAKVLAFTLGAVQESDSDIHVMMNMDMQAYDFELVALPKGCGFAWYRCADTSLPSPADFLDDGKEQKVTTPTYHVQPRSIVIVVSKK